MACGSGGKAEIGQSCTMNGLGEGTCDFTNTGDGKGAKCGQIVVHGNTGQSEHSSPICSGELAQRSTSRVSFTVADVRQLCDVPGRSWSDVCKFTFVGEGEPAPAFAGGGAANEAGLSATPERPTIPDPPHWTKSESVDPMDNSKRLALWARTDSPIHDQFGNPASARFVISCAKKKTEAVFQFTAMLDSETHSWSSDSGYGWSTSTQLRLRIDDGKPEDRRATPSTDSTAAYLKSPIADIKRMFDHDKLLVEFQPYNSGPQTTTFTITGLKEQISDIRANCKW